MGAKLIVVIGDEGTGKTSSLRYIDPETTGIITPNSKELPGKLEKQYINWKNRFPVNKLTSVGGMLKAISTGK